MAVAFDTLKAATRLQNEAGFNEKQARVLVATFAEGIGENLATKDDVAMLRNEMATKDDMAMLRSEIAGLRGEMATKEEVAVLRSEIAGLRNEMATKDDMAVLRNEIPVLRGEMRELEQRMTIRLGAMIAAAVGIIVALDKLL